ncbi:SRPBCC domain-containing protein [Staphylococcus schleiferi]|uniref:SRPBCC family protein n=1 Tax=Staphylococcus schleiferi TaxID=1295 RepID=UPI001888A55C|nr:SRPBCC domain-containing protein [Staphylococcus schleiferi]MBF1993771.1 SRPBCC domain-containing protein [Staphylococcus schleiferi]MBF2039338.1 SRPBCC domain-containing protein [Staphylococcus schleiferi]MBF2101337.1 SRPBCC domain-containing protein [Staphylococcus schleiferi]MBF2103498.1 SRPBCC domain-containing protein [Staphylococcus schleiferi]MBF2105634.1 SRPBCC domain-containing protein [Staphylococcus schleiferi]
MEVKHMQNEWVEIKLVRLMETTPTSAYRAWLEPEQLKEWFMTSRRTNQEIENHPVEGGTYRIVNQRQGKRLEIEGVYQTLVEDTHIIQTIQMPEFSDEADEIEVYFEERSPGITQMTFYYKGLVPKERRLTNLEYKQKKKAYHDHTAHGFELMFDTLQQELEAQQDVN